MLRFGRLIIWTDHWNPLWRPNQDWIHWGYFSWYSGTFRTTFYKYDPHIRQPGRS